MSHIIVNTDCKASDWFWRSKVLKYSVLAYTEQKLLEIVGDDTLTDEEKAIQANVCNSIIRYNAAAEAVLGKGAEPEEN